MQWTTTRVGRLCPGDAHPLPPRTRVMSPAPCRFYCQLIPLRCSAWSVNSVEVCALQPCSVLNGKLGVSVFDSISGQPRLYPNDSTTANHSSRVSVLMFPRVDWSKGQTVWARYRGLGLFIVQVGRFGAQLTSMPRNCGDWRRSHYTLELHLLMLELSRPGDRFPLTRRGRSNRSEQLLRVGTLHTCAPSFAKVVSPHIPPVGGDWRPYGAGGFDGHVANVLNDLGIPFALYKWCCC